MIPFGHLLYHFCVSIEKGNLIFCFHPVSRLRVATLVLVDLTRNPLRQGEEYLPFPPRLAPSWSLVLVCVGATELEKKEAQN